jgi:hypothetical protein
MILALVLSLAAGTEPAVREERFRFLLHTFPERPPAETFRQVEKLIEEGPFPQHDRAEYWMGSAALAAGDRESARRWFTRVAKDHPASVWEDRSWLGLGDAAAQERSYGEALVWYGRAQAATDAAVREVGRTSDRQVRILQRRQRLAWAAGALALAIGAFFAFGGRRGQWKPLPAETRIVLPVLGALALLSIRVDPAPRAAVLTLCAGGALLSLLSGVRLRTVAPGRAGRLVHALLAVAALGCVAYVAVYSADLIGMLQETFRVGPE